ncbi:MAG: AIR synthase-related protein, partial [Hyphomicrobium sp.]
DAACGLKLRRGDEDAREWPLGSNERAELIARYLRPQPRLDIAPLLRRVATAAMDLSDGLAKDLGRLAAASSAGALIERELLPVSPAVRRLASADPSIDRLILSGGDDYELLFVASHEHEAEIRTWAATAGTPVTRIGRISEAPGLLLRTIDGDRPLVPAGWEHF